MKKNETYKIKLCCNNCFTKFEHDVPVGIPVEEKGGMGIPVYVQYGDSYTHILCPNCKCGTVMKVRNF